jgi:hypothetical protein
MEIIFERKRVNNSINNIVEILKQNQCDRNALLEVEDEKKVKVLDEAKEDIKDLNGTENKETRQLMEIMANEILKDSRLR